MWFFFRLIKLGWQNFYRNFFLSGTAVLTLSLTLFCLSLIFLLNIFINSNIKTIQEKTDISLYFYSETPEKEILALKEKIKSFPETKEIIYKSAETALEEFKKKHQDESLILEVLAELEKNPLEASLIIKANSSENYQIILENLDKEENAKIIKRKNFEDKKELIEKISKIGQEIKKTGIGLGSVFGFISFLIIFITIKTNIFVRKEEIFIMRLVGAGNFYIRIPYIIEGILCGFFSSLISLLVLFFCLKFSSPYFLKFLEGSGGSIFLYFKEYIFQLIGLNILIGICLAGISSFLGTSRYLRY